MRRASLLPLLLVSAAASAQPPAMPAEAAVVRLTVEEAVATGDRRLAPPRPALRPRGREEE